MTPFDDGISSIFEPHKEWEDMSPRSVFRKGTSGLGGGGAGEREFVSLKDGEKVTLASLVNMDDLISIDQHAIWLDGGNSPMFPCIGDDCPGCELGNTARFRAFLPVVTIPDSESKVFAFGIKVARALEELDEEFGGLKGHMFTVRRKGTGLSTSYTVIAVGKKMDIADATAIDVESKLGPTTAAGIRAMLKESGAVEGDEAEAKPAKKGEDKPKDWEEV
jgi:hypothetical protein